MTLPPFPLAVRMYMEGVLSISASGASASLIPHQPSIQTALWLRKAVTGETGLSAPAIPPFDRSPAWHSLPQSSHAASCSDRGPLQPLLAPPRICVEATPRQGCSETGSAGRQHQRRHQWRGFEQARGFRGPLRWAGKYCPPWGRRLRQPPAPAHVCLPSQRCYEPVCARPVPLMHPSLFICLAGCSRDAGDGGGG